jgi:hypothetical protein
LIQEGLSGIKRASLKGHRNSRFKFFGILLSKGVFLRQ